MELTVKDISVDKSESASASAAYWADFSGIVLAHGDIFSFENRQYQLEVMNSRYREICVEKATGLGFSEIFILRTLHGCIHGRYRKGVLYLFPNADEMRKFSQSRFGPLIRANQVTIGKYVKGGGSKGTDTTYLKRVNGKNLFMDGATLTQVIGQGIQQKESPALRGKQVDCVVYDELDLMDEDIIAKAEGRMGDSDLKESVYISNPTIPGLGIDKIFNKSTQKSWNRRCSCGVWTCSDDYFPDLIGVKDGVGFCQCSKCGKPLGFEGEWVAKYPDREIEGYRISHLNSVKTDPYQMLQEYEEILETNGNMTDFYKFRLGQPYVSAEDKLRISDVMECCGQDRPLTGHSGPCAMGVDVGKIKHIVIGIRTGRERYEILKVAQLSEWNDIHDLAEKFHVKSCVIDIRPYEDRVREFQKAERYRIYLCEYTDNPMHDAVWDNKNLTVKAYRTGVFDATHRFVSGGNFIFPRRCPAIDEFAEQLCNAIKILETNKRTGTSVYRYRGENEHYRNALNYFYLAAAGGKIARVGSIKNRQTVANNEYSRI